jgi:hypothetical protein
MAAPVGTALKQQALSSGSQILGDLSTSNQSVKDIMSSRFKQIPGALSERLNQQQASGRQKRKSVKRKTTSVGRVLAIKGGALNKKRKKHHTQLAGAKKKRKGRQSPATPPCMQIAGRKVRAKKTISPPDIFSPN